MPRNRRRIKGVSRYDVPGLLNLFGGLQQAHWRHSVGAVFLCLAPLATAW